MQPLESTESLRSLVGALSPSRSAWSEEMTMKRISKGKRGHRSSMAHARSSRRFYVGFAAGKQAYQSTQTDAAHDHYAQ